MKYHLLLLFSCFIVSLQAQVTYPQNGVYDDREELFALKNATIYTDYDSKIENATLLIRKGVVEQVGTSVSIPKGAIVMDMKGKFIYPSFIDLFSDYGVPEGKAEGAQSRRPQMLSNKEGAYGWNEALKSEFSSYVHFKVDSKKAKEYRSTGFGTVLSQRMDGIARGSSSLVLLGEENETQLVLKKEAANHFSFRKGTSKQNYPSSLMGAIALLRQTYYDAKWYANQSGNAKEFNISLERWNALKSLPQIFDVRDRLEVLRANKLAGEFNLSYIFHGNGDEYMRADELKATGAAFILPLNFPEAYDVSDPFAALEINLEEMKHWELAASNAKLLSEKGIEIAFTANKLKDRKSFLKQLRKAVKEGLSEEVALKALTYTPANLIKSYNIVGSLEKGKLANFIVTSGPVFDNKTDIYQNWIRGKKYSINPIVKEDIRGTYQIYVEKVAYTLEVKGSPKKPSFTIITPDTIKVNHSISGQNINLTFKKDKKGENNLIRLNGFMLDQKNWQGKGKDIDGNWIVWNAKKTDEAKKEEKKAPKTDKNEEKGKLIYPFIAYGNEQIPNRENFVIKDVTVWTNEKDGILEDADVLVQDGKIKAVGKDLKYPSSVKIIEGKGMHLTSGIIDEHSHIAISRGVNEGTQVSSAEVRIGDVVNSEDVNIYRQLAGGVTTAQLLHGSANPIGGQSAIVKLRWGYTPEKMKLEGAKGFIKFALGENVKQSNWGDHNTIRFPQTRMGVEQVYDDYFTRAREYDKNNNGRRDLDLETVAEIVNKKRFITCHSYVQSEINMLMKVAERYNFNINTFTHILEGYKVADKMKLHGAGASTFSDWWAYKFEVKDAIPYNAAILQRMGVTTALNSDDAEMARRLNTEAAKAVKYGGISEEDAWKMVTLNPAKLLRIDDKVGSIKIGKDADLVLWNGHPMSMYTVVEKTIIDGVCFYDKTEDDAKKIAIQKERARLIQKMEGVKAAGGKTQQPVKKHHHHYHCDDVEDELKD